MIKLWLALISSDYIVKNHFEEIVNNFPQLKVFNSNDEIIRNEENYNQFDQICFCDFEITAYTSMKISKYAAEKKIQFSDLYSLKNYLCKLKNILN